MKPHIHLVTNVAVGIPLHHISFLPNLEYLLGFFLFGILIDIDHIFYFIWKHKTLRPRKWWQVALFYHKKSQPNFYIFHSPEFNFFLFLLSFFHHIFLILLLSNLIHIFLDIVNHYSRKGNLEIIRAWSITNAIIFLVNKFKKT